MIGDGKNKVVHSWKIRSRSGGQIQYSSMTAGRRIHINARKITAFSLMLIMVVSSLLAVIVTYNTANDRSTALWTNLNPVAVITGADTGSVGEMMSFNGSSSYDPNLTDEAPGYIVSYLWEFSDGRTFSGPVAYHAFADYGNYYVNLTVTDNTSATNTASKVAMIFLKGPVAKIAMPEKAIATRDVDLSAAQSYFFGDRPDITFPGRTIVNYSWDFGDGTKGYTMDITHNWASIGSYIVTLSVRDNGGNWSRPACALINILPEGIAAISVSLDRHSLLPSEAANLTLAIVDADGNVVTAFTGDVSIACNQSTGVTIPSTPYTFTPGDAGVHIFTGGVSFALDGSYNVSASVDADPSVIGYDFATVCNRTVEIEIYDMFEYTMQDYWERRAQYYNLADEGFRNTSPAIEIFRPTPTSNAGQLTNFYTIKVRARNIPEINMSSPTYAHLKNPTTGLGTANISIDFHMMNYSEALEKSVLYNFASKMTGYDGWEIWLTYNATLNRSAAEQILNLPASWVTQADVDTWWTTIANASPNYPFQRNWVRAFYPTVASPGYLGREGGYGTYVGRLDLRPCEDYFNFGQGYWNSMFRVVYIDPEHVALSYWYAGYGYSELISRFLYWGGTGAGPNYPNGTMNGIMPMEPWYDNMSLRVSIKDDHANLTMFGVAVYGFRSWTSDVAPADTATYRMEAARLDYLVSASGGKSEMDIYTPNRDATDPQYKIRDPGSSQYGSSKFYDYTPAVMTLKPGESLFIEAPKTLTVGYRPKAMIGNYSDNAKPDLGGYYDSLRMLERFGNATIHPIGASAGTSSLDARTGDLRIVGPFAPIIKNVTGKAWLSADPAPRIELWIGAKEVYAPVAAFLATPMTGDTTTLFDFNGSYSGDVEDSLSVLEARWDWESDGSWDTGWSTGKVLSHTFAVPGDYMVLLEVRDSSGLTNITQVQVHIDTVIPEFTDLSIPIISMVIMIAFFARRNNRKKED